MESEKDGEGLGGEEMLKADFGKMNGRPSCGGGGCDRWGVSADFAMLCLA